MLERNYEYPVMEERERRQDGGDYYSRGNGGEGYQEGGWNSGRENYSNDRYKRAEAENVSETGHYYAGNERNGASDNYGSVGRAKKRKNQPFALGEKNL